MIKVSGVVRAWRLNRAQTRGKPFPGLRKAHEAIQRLKSA
jgi:hypothetical protein